MKTLMTMALGAVLVAGCPNSQSGEPQYDDAASKEFVAAWSKRQGGDAAGATAAFQALVGKYPNSRAAARARQLLATPPGPPAPGPTPPKTPTSPTPTSPTPTPTVPVPEPPPPPPT